QDKKVVSFPPKAPVQSPFHHRPGKVSGQRMEGPDAIHHKTGLTADPSPHTSSMDNGDVEVPAGSRTDAKARIQPIQVFADGWQLRTYPHQKGANFNLDPGCREIEVCGNAALWGLAAYRVSKAGFVHECECFECSAGEFVVDGSTRLGC